MTTTTEYPNVNAAAQAGIFDAMEDLLKMLTDPDCSPSPDLQIQGWRMLMLNWLNIAKSLGEERDAARARVAELEAQIADTCPAA